MKAEHRELEVKLDAAGLPADQFNLWCSKRKPSRYEHVVGTDVYWRQGGNVLRHRKDPNGGPGELTVKLRTSTKSTRNRVEIDLKFAEKIEVGDVVNFLWATGWIPEFEVVKDCHIFWFDRMPGVEAVYYNVRCFPMKGKELPARTFVEFEIHKSHSNHLKAQSVLTDWEKAARRELSVFAAPIQESLYEIFSGKRYGMAKRKR